MRKEGFVKDLFHFSRQDRIAMTCLLIMIAGIIFLPRVLVRRPVPPVPELISSGESTDLKTETKGSPTYSTPISRYKRIRNFVFDPNQLEETGWRDLGLPERTIRTILNYRARGGKFRQPEDLAKIYGLQKGELIRLQPLVRITEAAYNEPRLRKNETIPFTEKSYPSAIKTARNKKQLDINEADSSAWESLPGIGAKLSSRIIHFREKLGGFYSLSQVGETFGLADSVFQRILPFLILNMTILKKISINSASLEELQAHPYIRFSLARSIIQYRNEHGPFEKLEDLKKIMPITEEVFRKLEPYLSI